MVAGSSPVAKAVLLVLILFSISLSVSGVAITFSEGTNLPILALDMKENFAFFSESNQRLVPLK
jgi:hypothetical protein